MSQTFFIKQNIVRLIMTYCRYSISLRPLTFYAHYYDLPNTNKSLALIRQNLQSQHQLSSFILSTTNLNYHNILTQLNNY